VFCFVFQTGSEKRIKSQTKKTTVTKLPTPSKKKTVKEEEVKETKKR